MSKRFFRLWFLPIVVLILTLGIAGTGSAIEINIVTVDKDFTDLQPIDIELPTESLLGNFYFSYVVFENVTNLSGIAWNDFHFTLGYGAGDEFVQSEDGDGLNFIGFFGLPVPPFPVSEVPYSSAFAAYEMLEDTLDWWDGLVAEDESVDFGVGILVANIGPDIEAFTLREQPSPIPEPTTMFLVGSGLVGLAGFRKRFRKS
jgi:hypothetical protein